MSDYIEVPFWLARVYKVINIDTNEQFKIDAETKLIYSYLSGLGESVHPKQSIISSDLGIKLKSVNSKIRILNAVGLITTVPPVKSCFPTPIGLVNNYTVVIGCNVPRLKWFSHADVQLEGDAYTFTQ